MPFPTTWPQDCPPADAEPANGVVFRLVRNNPPAASDFLSYAEEGKCPRRDPCLRCGLSVYRTLEDTVAKHAELRERFPDIDFGQHVASATLSPEHGKTKQTFAPTHTTWWACEGVGRCELFVLLRSL
jgi:hypothetical protein